MHAWTHSSWVESPGRHSKPHLLSLSSACNGLATVSYLICDPLHAALSGNKWILDSQKGHHHRCHKRADHMHLFVLGWAFVHSISCLLLIPNYTHLLQTCSAVLLIKAVSARSCWILKCLLHRCCVTAGFGRLISRLKKGSHRTINKNQSGNEP